MTNSYEAYQSALLKSSLSAAVPLWIHELQKRPWSEVEARRVAAADVIAHYGDNILFRSTKRGETARAFNALAEALAICAFYPGGVTFLGDHWEAHHGELGVTVVEQTRE